MAPERLDDVEEAEVKLVMQSPWSPDRMTDEARDQLGIFEGFRWPWEPCGPSDRC